MKGLERSTEMTGDLIYCVWSFAINMKTWFPLCVHMQGWCELQQKRPLSLVRVRGFGHFSPSPLHPQFHYVQHFQRTAGRAVGRRACSNAAYPLSKSWQPYSLLFYSVSCCSLSSLTISLMSVSQGIVMYLWDCIPEDGQVVFVIIFGAFCYLLLFLAKYFAGWALHVHDTNTCIHFLHFQTHRALCLLW